MTGYYANYYVADVGKVRRSFGSGYAHPPREIFSDFSRIVSPQADLAISCIDRCLLSRDTSQVRKNPFSRGGF